MAEHAIDPFASRQTTSSHYITFQAAAKRLTKTQRQKRGRKFRPPTIFRPVGELGLTSGYRRFQQAKIEALGITQLFDEIHIDAVDESRVGKAAIISDLVLSRKWNPRDLLIVGDSATNEIDAGVRLGIFTVQILRPGVIATELADRHIHSLFELCGDSSTH